MTDPLVLEDNDGYALSYGRAQLLFDTNINELCINGTECLDASELIDDFVALRTISNAMQTEMTMLKAENGRLKRLLEANDRNKTVAAPKPTTSSHDGGALVTPKPRIKRRARGNLYGRKARKVIDLATTTYAQANNFVDLSTSTNQTSKPIPEYITTTVASLPKKQHRTDTNQMRKLTKKKLAEEQENDRLWENYCQRTLTQLYPSASENKLEYPPTFEVPDAAEMPFLTQARI